VLTLFNALGRALRDLPQPRVLAVLIVPMLGAIVLWCVLAFFFWGSWTSALGSLINGTSVAQWLIDYGGKWIVESLGVLLVIALVFPATLITAVLVTELIAMPVVVSVASRRYPRLAKQSGGTAIGSMGNALGAVSIFSVLWIVTLPLWLTGIGAVVVPTLNSAFLNQRLFRYDALAEHASRDEFAAIIKRHRAGLFGLGLLLAPLYYVPLVNLAAPVLTGLAFTHYCLSALAEVRRSDEKE
jgi:CysZ protein